MFKVKNWVLGSNPSGITGTIQTAKEIDKKLKDLNKLVIDESTKADEGYFLFNIKK